MSSNEQPQVVILGGGFGGLAAAQELSSEPVRVTLVDRRNHHLFQPLLYQVASAALSPADIAMPIRRVVRRQRNISVILGEAISIDTAGKRVVLRDDAVAYDYLIIATGATHSYFGHDNWAEAAPGLKTLEDATEIRPRVLVAFEAAERADDPEALSSWLTFVIVGGGSTGVELAGALAEISNRVLSRDFRRIQPQRARIVLVEGAPRVLPIMSEESSRNAERQLKRMGVELMLNTVVTDVDDSGVTYGRGHIASHTVIWAAGVVASPLGRSLGAATDGAGRVLVNQDLSVPKAPDVFVIGDLATIESEGEPVPGVAPAAAQEGYHAARNIIRMIRGESVKPFRYVDKGTLASIGRGAAVADIGRIRLSGFLAWITWLGVHIFYLIGFRNRFIVMAQWAWLYLWNERGARLITGDVESLLKRGRRNSMTINSPTRLPQETSQRLIL